YAKWWLHQRFVGWGRQPVPGIDKRLKRHVDFAQDAFTRHRSEISATMRKHQLALADRQCRMAELSQRVQDTVTILVTPLYANQRRSEVTIEPAALVCQALRRKLTGQRASDAYFKSVSQLAEAILSGGFEELAGVPQGEIMQRYDNKR